VHRSPWPQVEELGDAAGDATTLDAVAAALIGIRGAKSQAKVSMRHELSAVEFTGPASALDAVRLAEQDLLRAGRITAAPTYVASDDAELSVAATVAEG
jgi:valyl-tRNA synthetase